MVESGTHAELASTEGGLFRQMLLGQAIEGTSASMDAPPNEDAAEAAAEADAAGGNGTAAGEAETAEAAGAGGLVSAPTDDKGGSATSNAGGTGAAGVAADGAAAGATRSRVLRRVWAMQRPDAHLFPLGVLAAAGGGCIQPCLALVYGGAIALFFSPDEEYMRSMVRRRPPSRLLERPSSNRRPCRGGSSHAAGPLTASPSAP